MTLVQPGHYNRPGLYASNDPPEKEVALPERIKFLPQLTVLVILVVCLFNMVSVLYQDPYSLQWDFHTYYHAAIAHEAGLNPYDAANISKVSGKNWTPPYIYPPLTLKFFSLLNVFEYPLAAKIWLFLKIAMMAALVLVWHRYFTSVAPIPYFLLFLVFAFASAFYWDLKTGNVSIVEQFLLWMAFLFLIKDRPRAFCLLLIAASVFKLAFMLFLPLLIAFNVRRKWVLVSATVGALAVYLLANYLLYPDLIPEYWAQVRAANDLGDRYNLGSLAFVMDFFNYFGWGDLKAVQFIVYAGLVSVLAVVTVYFARPVRKVLFNDKALTILLSCALYAVSMPRMKCYSFLILILPAFFIIKRLWKRNGFPFIFLLLILPIRSPFDDSGLVLHFRNYYSLYLAYIVWGLFIWHIRGTGSGGASAETVQVEKQS